MPLSSYVTRRMQRRLVLVALLTLTVVWATVASAQNSSLTLYVFDKGLPAADIEVILDDNVVGSSNDQGLVQLDIEAGLHRLELRRQDLLVLDQQIIAHEGEISQWIVNITRGLSALTDIESSGSGGLVAAAAEAAPAANGEPGTLSGVLTNAEDGSAVDGARIFISGQSRDIRSDKDGKFELELSTGDYSVSVLQSNFNTLTRDGIKVIAGEQVSLQLELTPSGTELPEFVVIEPYISGSLASVLEERRSDAVVANILGAEQISKSGDTDAAGALRRVTGLTLVDGRFIYIRGLGERYSSTLLNGANVPSPDATRRVVPLDLFPAGIIESIAVQKGYTGNLPGEFGGGAVEIKTKSIPEAPFFNVDFSLAYREGTTFKDGLRYDGGGRDWLGYDDGTRAQSSELREATADGAQLKPFNRFTDEGFQPEDLENVGESLAVNYDVGEEKIDPNTSLAAAGGYVWDFGDKTRFGFLAAVNYKDDWLSVTQQRTDFINAGGGVLESQNDFMVDITGRSIDLTGFVTMGLEVGDNHRVAYNWMLLRNTTDKAQIEQGFNKDASGGDVRFTELEWIERQMVANQLNGESTFPALAGLKVNWQYTAAVANSDAPDTRRHRYDPDTLTPEEDDFIFSIRNDSNQRRWSELEDDSNSWNVDFSQPVSLFKNADIAILAGINHVKKTRDSAIRRFAFKSRGRLSGNIDLRRNESLEDIIFSDTIDPNGWQLEEVTIATDAYTAKQNIEAWYLGIDSNIAEMLRLGGGFRNETSSQSVSTFNLFDPENNAVVSNLDTKDIFPYFNGTWFLGNHQIRFGYAQTINRPDFKELSESLYKDPILDRLVKGNPNLIAAFLTHYDLRWDFYFNPGEFVSLGVFYKQFENPIESVILASADSDLTSFENAESAVNFGVEFELYKSLGFLNNWWSWGAIWDKFYVNTNYAWIDSEITLVESNSNIQTSTQRPLQGQSPFVWNLQLGYNDEDRNINAALLYNVFGERIVDVGVAGAPDVLERPRPSLDFVYSQGFGDWKLKLKLKNLLDPNIELTQGSEVTRSTQVGREYTIGVQYTFK